MSAVPPFSEVYNLARLGNAGDEVSFAADATVRAAIARWAGVSAIGTFAVTVVLRKPAASRFVLEYRLEAEVVQACVVSLAPVPARIARSFVRELHFTGPQRHGARPQGHAVAIAPEEAAEEPEEIESLHYDLAAPALEEFVLALDPYPRAPGAEFSAAEAGAEARPNPFAALKVLKNRI